MNTSTTVTHADPQPQSEMTAQVAVTCPTTQGLKRLASVGVTPAMGEPETSDVPHTVLGNHDKNQNTAEPLPLVTVQKRQKTYVQAVALSSPVTETTVNALAEVRVADYPINTPVISTDGTKGIFAGAQSFTPGRTRVACYMERGGGTSAELIELKKIHFSSTN